MSADSFLQARQAQDPSTPPEVLDRLADQFPELHAALVANPGCPEGTRAWILQQSPGLRQAYPPQLLQQPVPTPSPVPVRSGSSSGLLLAGLVLLLVLMLPIVAYVASILSSRGVEELSTGSSSQRDVTSDLRSGSTPDSDLPDKKETPKQLASPAPRTAVYADLVDTPSENISCELYENSVSCSILTRTYKENGQQDCSSRLFSITVSHSRPTLACGEEFLGVPGQHVTRLQYGSSARSEKYACTSRTTGMTCWNQETGHGFTIYREGYDTF